MSVTKKKKYMILFSIGQSVLDIERSHGSTDSVLSDL